MTRDEVIQILKDELEFGIETTSVYAGIQDDSGGLYRDVTTLTVWINGDVVFSEQVTA